MADCTEWGPRCPQNRYDVGYLLREPEGDVFYSEREDEFECLNLDVTVPTTREAEANLPVLLWVHGGSQIISYGSGASKIGDVRKIANEAVAMGRPMSVVSVQYRLNIFHVGDGQGTKNLGLKDLHVAVQWVRDHIAGFGGNPDEITLAGESAGGALSHALIVSGAKVKRGVLMSGSLYMSGPQPEARAKSGIIDPVLANIRAKGYDSLEEAPISALLEAQLEVPILSVFLQQEPELEHWQAKTGEIEELVVGDCEFESVLWRNGIENLSAEHITSMFDKAGESSSELKSLYHINPSRPTPTKHGALDFVNDVLWVLPTRLLTDLYRKNGKRAFTYLFDQPNPWQASSRAHHAVDLIYLFGGFDLSHNPPAEALGTEMRKRFISYVNGEAPWNADKTFAFGPLGDSMEIEAAEVDVRRRTKAVERLKGIPPGEILSVLGSLVAGRISLMN